MKFLANLIKAMIYGAVYGLIIGAVIVLAVAIVILAVIALIWICERIVWAITNSIRLIIGREALPFSYFELKANSDYVSPMSKPAKVYVTPKNMTYQDRYNRLNRRTV